jgi:hypothetical protein
MGAISILWTSLGRLHELQESVHANADYDGSEKNY